MHAPTSAWLVGILKQTCFEHRQVLLGLHAQHVCVSSGVQRFRPRRTAAGSCAITNSKHTAYSTLLASMQSCMAVCAPDVMHASGAKVEQHSPPQTGMSHISC